MPVPDFVAALLSPSPASIVVPQSPDEVPVYAHFYGQREHTHSVTDSQGTHTDTHTHEQEGLLPYSHEERKMKRGRKERLSLPLRLPSCLLALSLLQLLSPARLQRSSAAAAATAAAVAGKKGARRDGKEREMDDAGRRETPADRQVSTAACDCGRRLLQTCTACFLSILLLLSSCR